MDLVLLACSERKQPGGMTAYTPSRYFDQALSPELLQKLLASRSEIVKRITDRKLPIGPDVGISGAQRASQLFLPAYRRYTGIVYERGRVQLLYPKQHNIRLVIISALYGLLDGEDLIQDYNLRMENLISGQRLHTWWKNQHLGDIVEEYILSWNPTTIHDLLPINYQKALQPWPPKRIGHRWKPLDCSGMGQGSSYKRGEFLELLLKNSM